ncbi:Arm DNA-binding domain-containing protein [Rhodobacter calidifons]|uniref:DUF4102 domain-containing protein n=1 Tax=Rhodobacter calidifons TaxID=2715277 RepID=A0ABX0GAV3_9RHOB|nr:DUF4102 domain-containing protein [Rhodobacter calidifons]
MPSSDAKIRSLRPRERDFKVGDFGGLYLLVKKTGSRPWRFKRRVHGREKLMVFGNYPHVGLARAHALRDEAKSKSAAGRGVSVDLNRFRAFLKRSSTPGCAAAISSIGCLKQA